MPDEPLPLGLGTYENTDPETCANAVEHALDVGYHHVDITRTLRVLVSCRT